MNCLIDERTGNLVFVASSAPILDAVKTQMEIIIRTLWSNPPNHGARIVATVLNKNTYKQEWLEHVKEMANRILLMRRQLFEKFRSLGTKGNWDHIVTQTGMFSYTGLNRKFQCFMVRFLINPFSQPSKLNILTRSIMYTCWNLEESICVDWHRRTSTMLQMLFMMQ